MAATARDHGAGLFLIGYRGSGKSTVGRLLAGWWKCAFADTDRLVEERAGRELRQIFAELGEDAFRALEEEILEQVAARGRGGEPLVVATGGGIVLRTENVERMRRAGLVVWLAAAPRVLRERIQADPRSLRDRPALAGTSALDEIDAVLAARRELYASAADCTVETGSLDAAAVARQVDSLVSGLRSRGAGGAVVNAAAIPRANAPGGRSPERPSSPGSENPRDGTR